MDYTHACHTLLNELKACGWITRMLGFEFKPSNRYGTQHSSTLECTNVVIRSEACTSVIVSVHFLHSAAVDASQVSTNSSTPRPTRMCTISKLVTSPLFLYTGPGQTLVIKLTAIMPFGSLDSSFSKYSNCSFVNLNHRDFQFFLPKVDFPSVVRRHQMK